ncbi:vomeronasal type-2 receptor 26-like [Hyla sarda]|uniref:vomeronasal type-2 receptor 26-like n=1 Tax=Hyla sarda TaxID=327740 RepID=UPI0024C39DA4|nr:vomeronasal type-2 receptor 26-like [Hyla sarda]
MNFRPSLQFYRHLLVFFFTLEEINKNLQFLPNISLGYQIFDSCANVHKSVYSTFRIMSGGRQIIPNYSCWNQRKMVGFIGEVTAASSYVISQLAGIYRYPQISYGTMTSVFTATDQFPSFYQAAANELSEIDAIVQLVKHLGWKWVGILVSDDDTGQIAGEMFKKEIVNLRGCVAFFIILRDDSPDYYHKKIIDTINKSSTNVTVAFLSVNLADAFVRYFALEKQKPKIWITSSSFSRVSELQRLQIRRTFNGTLSLSSPEGEIPGFREYFYSIKPIKYPGDNLVRNIWEYLALCTFSTSRSDSYPICIGNETLNDDVLSIFHVFVFRSCYSIYTAVYAMAHSLHDMYATSKSNNLLTPFQPWRLKYFLQSVNFITSSGDAFYFKHNKQVPTRLDLLKYNFISITKVSKVKVGNYDETSTAGFPFNSLKESEVWGPYFHQAPPSLCNEACEPGYRMAKREGEPPCCYDCVQCTKGEMSNSTDSRSCWKCSRYENSNIDRTGCVPKDVDFLSYGETLGGTLTIVSLLFSIVTSVILGIFWTYRETPIVKANNRKLSYVLLISITLCFMCTLLFIGRPSPIRCLLRQAAFGVVFTVSVSSVLAKTLTVIMAFKATRPGSRMKRLLGMRLPDTLVVLCSMGEVLLSVIWIMFYPPYLDADTETDTILLLCNEGSSTFFFLEIGYIGMLALISLGAAFLAKDFPDRFNEAKNISFSILVFSSVWVTFVPTYLSVKGKNMVAVEVFAILTSSAGLLSFIFLPKCYVILISQNCL